MIGGIVVGIAFLVIVAMTVYGIFHTIRSAIRDGRPGTLSFESARSPSEILPAAIHYFATDGWTVTSQGNESAAFSCTDGPSGLAVLVFLCLGLIPGVIYLLVSKRTVTASITSHRGDGGGSITYISWNRTGRAEAPSMGLWRAVYAQEPELEATAQIAQLPEPPTTSGSRGEAACSRCGALGLRSRELARVPILCDECRAQRGRRRRVT